MEPNTALSERSLANPVGDKSAMVHWYCAVADDSCLCQPCDLSVHSANHRIRLKTSSRSSPEDDLHNSAWHRGFSRKARTSRPKKKSGDAKDESGTGLNLARLVPDMCSEDNLYDESDEQLLHRVPRLDPFVADLCTLSEAFQNNDNNNSSCFGSPRPAHDGMGHFLPTEMDLAELAAYEESLLRNGLEHESSNMKGYRILDCDEDKRDKAGLFNNNNNDYDFVEEGDFIGIGKEGFVLNFDYDSPVMSEENKLQGSISEACDSKNIFLKLDYEGVMSAWDDRKSPWITGERPAFDSSREYWPHRVGSGTKRAVYEDEKGMTSTIATVLVADGGREAKVSRYREKRRTRLFSKKIRYEVRKLNAEKRPRMKGRFVKRLSSPFSFPQ